MLMFRVHSIWNDAMMNAFSFIASYKKNQKTVQLSIPLTNPPYDPLGRMRVQSIRRQSLVELLILLSLTLANSVSISRI